MTDSSSSLAARRVEAFHLRHGGQCFFHEGWYWYPDGARREDDLQGAMVEPPSLHVSMTPDRLEYDLAHCKLRFYQAKLGAAVEQYKALEEHLYFSPPTNEEAEDTAIAKMEALKKVVEARTEEVRKAQSVVDSTTIGERLKRGANRGQAATARNANWRARLKTVRI